MALLTFLFESVTPGMVFSTVLICFVLSVIAEHVMDPQLPPLPVVGNGTGFIAALKNIVQFSTHSRKWATEGYEKYGIHGRSFIIPRILAKPPTIVLPHTQSMWMLNYPDNVISVVDAHEKILNIKMNCLVPDGCDLSFHAVIVHKNLARNLNKLIPGLQDDVIYSVDKVFGTDTENWVDVNIWDACLTLVPIITSRMLIGAPQNRNESYNKSMVQYTHCVIRNNFILSFVPIAFRPLVIRLLTLENWWHWRKMAKLVVPIICERQRLAEQIAAAESSVGREKENVPGDAIDDKKTLPVDYLSWAVQEARKGVNPLENNPKTVSKRLLPVNFAAVHTTALTGHALLLNVFAAPPSVADTLREEAASVLQACGGRWTKTALMEMFRTDSAIRESQRLSTVGLSVVERRVKAPEGVTNQAEGWHAEKGTSLILNYDALHHSNSLYANPWEYDPFRFSRSRDESEMAAPTTGETKALETEASAVNPPKATKIGMVTTTETHLAFGHGRHACPGRFFVAHELKMILAYLLLNYDIQPLESRPQPTVIGQSILPPVNAKIRVRRRHVPFSLSA